MGIHISTWAGKTSNDIYKFLLPFGLDKNNVVGEDFDFLVNDPSDRDADFYKLVLHTEDRMWDMSDDASIHKLSFNQHIYFLKSMNQISGKNELFGNSNHKNIPNSNKLVDFEGYKDNRAEYFFGDHDLCHCKRYAEAGVYALKRRRTTVKLCK